MHGGGLCVVGGHARLGGMHGRGHTWRGVCVARGACVAGGMHGREGDMRGSGRHAWHTVNERVVRILLECILVFCYL